MTTQGEYDVFVSHASEDKKDFVKPLVDRLGSLGLRVWYDDLSLELGDSLRENIDRGLAASTYGVVVLSRAFFAKRWPERELNGLVQKAMGEGRKVILPVWHAVTREEVEAYSLPLADLLAARSDQGVYVVADSIARVIRGRGGAEDADDIDRSHQLTEQRLLASVKRIIADPTQIIGIRELVDALARDAYTHLKMRYESALSEAPQVDVAKLFADYRGIMRSALSVCALAANLGDPAHFPSVSRVVSILARDPGPETGRRLTEGLWQYPAVLLMYAIGLSALQQNRLALVRDTLLGVKHELLNTAKRVPLVEYIQLDSISEFAKRVYQPGENRTYKTPLSEHLFMELHVLLDSYFVDDKEFEHTFDLFEYIVDLVCASISLREGGGIGWVPPGRYMWKNWMNGERTSLLKATALDLGVTALIFDGHSEWTDEAADYLNKCTKDFKWR